MLGVRLLFIVVGLFLVLSLFGYALNRDPRWLRFAGLGLKSGIALIALLMLVYLAERLLIAL